MTFLRIFLKVVALPVMLAATLLQWIGVFLVGFSAIIFNLFAGLCFLVAVLTFLMGIATGVEALRTLVMAFVVFIIPRAGETIVEGIAAVNYGLRDFIKS